ncbi:prepilin-type N-terminal cleavage/methylation domain-containing protein [Candidatus Babeliales bacterium]|nr:prepilin-type N-terminal cleavage/methylation domain-containing protein [Candidatus Babeliales bacterium]
MIPFKNKNTGFSFIEMMIALTLLAVFGTSIFLVQANITSKVFKTHTALQPSYDMNYLLYQLNNKILQATIRKEDVNALSVSVEHKNPQETITLTLHPIAEKSELYKPFSKHIRAVHITQKTNDSTKVIHTFAYIPTIKNDDKNKNNTDTNQPAAKGQ